MNEKLPEGWKRVKLGEVAEIIMGQSPKSEFYNEKGDGLPFLQGNRTFGYRFPKIDMYCSKPIKIAKKSDVLFSVRAPVGDINIANQDICIGRGLAAIRANNHSITLYLYYLLKFLKNEILNFEGGTVFGSISKKDLEGIETLIPEDINEQKAIASVLSSLDDKIDLLHRQNQTLEQKAETLFRKWFIEEAKEDWEEVKLGDVLENIESGSRPKGGIDPNLKTGIPSIGAENINGLGNFDFSKVKYISNEYFNKMKRGIVKDYDVLIYKDGAYIGRKSMFGKGFPFDKLCINEHVFILRTNDRISQFFLYFLLDEEELRNLNTNSAQPGLNQNTIKSLPIIIPPKDLITKFDSIVKTWIDKIFFNGIQIRTLEDLRDTLLPKLMSGEWRVKNEKIL